MRYSFILSIILLCTLAVFVSNSNAGGLIALYEFENDPNDSSGNNLDAVANGGPTYGAGMFGQAIYFDGVDDFLDCGTGGDPNSGGDPNCFHWVGPGRPGRTVTFWATSDWLYNQSKQPTIIAKGGITSWRMQRYNNTSAATNRFDFQTTGTSPSSMWDNTVNPPLSPEWHHYAITDNGSVRKLFYDGTVVKQLPSYTGTCAEVAGRLVIGGNPDSTNNPATRYWKGWVDDMAIFNYALSEDLIALVKDNGAANLPATEQKATFPSPVNGALDQSILPVLSWVPGFMATEHRLYLSTNQQAVINRTAPYVTIAAPDLSYIPPQYLLLNTTYYWCVDEINGGTTPGDLWSFTTGSSYLFQSATAFANNAALQAAWLGSVIQPELTPSNWMGLNYWHSTASYTRNVGGIDMSQLGRFSVRYNFVSSACGTVHPELTLKLLGESDAVLYSGTCGNIAGRPAGSQYTYHFDLSKAVASLNSVQKIVFEMSPAPAECYLWLAVGDIVFGDSVCGTGTIYSPYDKNADCVTDLSELTLIASDWLDSYIAVQ